MLTSSLRVLRFAEQLAVLLLKYSSFAYWVHAQYKMSEPPVDSDLPETLQSRLQSLQDLTAFTEQCRTRLKELFDQLGWDQDRHSHGNDESTDVCPYDPSHRVPRRTMDAHKARCELGRRGYGQDEQAAMCDPTFCYEQASVPRVIVDKATQQQVIHQARASATPLRSDGLYGQSDYSACVPEVPQNHKRASCDLTVADRLALYDHVIREANQQITKAEITSNDDLYVDWVAKLKKDENLSGPKSHLEALAEMRDFKRRRQSYRAKNVHITKKSYTEVIREVIGVHCNELSRLWQEEMKEEEESKIPKHSHRRDSKDRRSSSTESHTSSRDRHTSHQRRQRSKERSQKLSHEEENSSKGRRDSHSPEERHRHHHKKKKKKKSSK
ncbi:U11/U12 small nuclear ribonucleoprotein 48 kDa protein isoform X2 [Denticeps clupeoides]|uniref:CHHC U11-48K-type domain-containing protein n=1 Tax=Denticeps clupeoides TaxID=299321 RepID=A0AAY4B324_9TELE|nr:U11/U12 small nuclear ribonucleoprotein 48 kDa protein isoform X2 [Denticeps clupeoides]